jgi:6-pyruvoyltetrahydropterin/6-carboxytetrahydropterin synthase
MYRISTECHFDSAHFLKGYKGKCSRLHGHRWQVRIYLTGNKLDKIGMLIDFGSIKKILKSFCDELDHKLLNELPLFKKHNPTAEYLAKAIYQELIFYLYSKTKDSLKLNEKEIKLEKVRVYESPDSYAEFSEN